MTGWISLHRSIEDHWLWETDRAFTRLEAWIDILLMVNHKERKIMIGNDLITVKRGQKITSIRKLCERWSWSNSKVKKFLELLERDEMLIVKSDTKKTVITVVNYDFYQSQDYKKRHESDTETTEKRRESDTKATRKHTNNNDNNELIMNNNVNKSVGVVSENLNQDYSEIISEYNKLAFGLPTPRTYEQIEEWLKLHNKELIIHVMQYAHDLGKNNISYVNGILRNAKQKQIETVEDFESENNRFNSNQTNQQYNNSYANSLEARTARRQAKEKIERDRQNLKQ